MTGHNISSQAGLASIRVIARERRTMSEVNADVVLAALSNILDGLMDRGSAPAVRLSNTKQRVVRLMNQIDSQRTNRENGDAR